MRKVPVGEEFDLGDLPHRVCSHVLAALGVPPGMRKIAAAPIGEDRWRVNIWVRDEAEGFRIVHSYYVVTAEDEVRTVSPPVVRRYPRREAAGSQLQSVP